MNPEIECSVIVLTHNRPERCADSIRHNAAALAGLPAEILVVNNGQALPDLPSSPSGIPCRLIQMDRNRGAAARNEGIRQARGRFVLILDDDSYIDAGLADNMMRAFHADPSLGSVAFRIENNGKEEACLLPTVFHGCACGFRMDALRAAGGYPEGFLYYGEEYDLAFRLYQAGYRSCLCNHDRMVRHVRDAEGRDLNRIVKLLIRNNFQLWIKFLPWRAIPDAVADTLMRYALVARKENAWRGFVQGLATLPGTILSSLPRRRPLSKSLYGEVALTAQVASLCRRMRESGARDLIVCGVGKFPSAWIRTIRRHGIRLRELWDYNTCWTGRSIRGIHVRVVDRDIPPIPPGCRLLIGTASVADNARWQRQLQAGGLGTETVDLAFFSPAGSALAEGYDLQSLCELKVFSHRSSPPRTATDPVASGLLSWIPAK